MTKLARAVADDVNFGDAVDVLGVMDVAGPCQAYRLPFADSTLSALSKAAEQTRLPATLLLKVCLYCLD